jgi:hypothetical protein
MSEKKTTSDSQILIRESVAKLFDSFMIKKPRIREIKFVNPWPNY